jgi:hypothetical protein
MMQDMRMQFIDLIFDQMDKKPAACDLPQNTWH